MEPLENLNIPNDVKADIKLIVDTLCSKFSPNIQKLLLFGSYSNNTYQPDSDLDIAAVLYQLPEPKQRRLYTQSIDIDRDVDLLFCTEEQLESKAFVYRHIHMKGIVLYEQL